MWRCTIKYGYVHIYIIFEKKNNKIDYLKIGKLPVYAFSSLFKISVIIFKQFDNYIINDLSTNI